MREEVRGEAAPERPAGTLQKELPHDVVGPPFWLIKPVELLLAIFAPELNGQGRSKLEGAHFELRLLAPSQLAWRRKVEMFQRQKFNLSDNSICLPGLDPSSRPYKPTLPAWPPLAPVVRTPEQFTHELY